MKNEQKILGMRIRNIRKKQNLSQEQLSELTNLDETTISRIENGKRFPTLENFIVLLKVLKIEPNTVLDFIKFDTKRNQKDIMLYEAISGLDDDVKDKLFELIKVIK